MLSRAALRPVRTTALRSAPIGIAGIVSDRHWVRGYAKDHKSKERKPLAFGGQPARNLFPAKNESTVPKQRDGEYSKQQPEFQTSASPEENIDPAQAKEQSTREEDVKEERPQPEQAPEEERREQEERTQQQQALPDLRQGLPSTIDRELRSAASKSKGARVSIANLTEASHDGGDIPASPYVSSAELKREKWTNWAVVFAFGTILLSPFYLGRNWESEEEEQAHPDAPSGFNVKSFFLRIHCRLRDFLGYYTEPAFRKLLPDVTDPSFGREYTLVMNLEDLLIHNEWSREKGWRLAKRPGLDYFLRYLQQYYELVIWTTQPFSIAEVVVAKLDPYHLCQPLFREATVYSNGEHIKDLTYLNRDPSKVIVIETNPASVQRQPENAIIVKKFEGDPGDKELISLIPFLEYIAAMQTKDVREVLKIFEGTHIPTEFAKREAIARKKHEARLAEELKNHPKSRVASWGAALLGIKPQPQYEGEITFAEALAQGKMIQDMYRERGQREYEKFNKLILTEGPNWLAEEAAMQKKMQEEAMRMSPLAKLGLLSAPPPPSSGSEGSSPAK